MKKVYVEFNGLPGCGKSTVCQEMAVLLEGQMPVVRLSEKKASEPKGKMHFCRQVLSLIAGGRGGLVRDVLLFSWKLPRGTPKRWTCFYSSVRDYALTLKMFQEMESGILLCDQGVLQHFLSGLYNQNQLTGMKEAGHIMKRAAADFATFLEINLNLSPEISLERMNKRKGKASRLEQVSEEEAGQLMALQDSILTGLRKALCDPNRTMDADARKTPAENAGILSEQILKRIRESE